MPNLFRRFLPADHERGFIMGAARQDEVEARREERWPMQAPVTVRLGDGVRRQGTLEELSSHGCRLHLAGAGRPGDRLRVQVQHFEPFYAALVWSEGEHCGLSFEQPLHPAVVDHLVRLGQR